ncbi:MAG: hypothetical protein AB7K68_14945 [Bacteriovoracia bacterium]
MKLLGKRNLLLMITLAVGLTSAVSTWAREEGGVSDGGGSQDAQTGRMVDAYLEQHRFVEGIRIAYNHAYAGNPGPPNTPVEVFPYGPKRGLYFIFMNGLMPAVVEAFTTLNDVSLKKPWYLVPFDKKLLKKVNERTRTDLINSGFLRNTNQVAIQTPGYVLIDKNYFDAQVRRLKAKNEKVRDEAFDNIVTLVLHEMVRDMELKSRRAPGETDEQAVGKGGYHRYGMPPMTEENVLIITEGLKKTAAMMEEYTEMNRKEKRGTGDGTEEAQGAVATFVQDLLAKNNYGYYLSRKVQWGDFNQKAELINHRIEKACDDKDYGTILDQLLDLQTIARSELIGDKLGASGWANWPKLKVAERVEYFELLNSYLAVTKQGRLKKFEGQFQEDENTAKQICRGIRMADFVRNPLPKDIEGAKKEVEKSSAQGEADNLLIPQE